MGRQIGYKLSDEQKEKIKEGKRNRKLKVIKEIIIEEKTNKKRGRPKGSKLSYEAKQKAKQTRENHKLGIFENTYEKQILKITGREKTGFDFWPALRLTLRPIHRYNLCHEIERKIVSISIWKDIEAIKIILSEYFDIEEE
jgi:hypothetical protein